MLIDLVVSFVENKFQDTLTEESKVIRSPGIRDSKEAPYAVFMSLLKYWVQRPYADFG